MHLYFRLERCIIMPNNFKFITVVILTLVSSCRVPDNFGFNQPITLSLAVPDGPAEYKAGWYGGCKSGLAAKATSGFANTWVYGEGKGPELGNGIYQHDPVFQTGWGQGWFACTVHASTFTSMNSMQVGPLE